MHPFAFEKAKSHRIRKKERLPQSLGSFWQEEALLRPGIMRKIVSRRDSGLRPVFRIRCFLAIGSLVGCRQKESVDVSREAFANEGTPMNNVLLSLEARSAFLFAKDSPASLQCPSSSLSPEIAPPRRRPSPSLRFVRSATKGPGPLPCSVRFAGARGSWTFFAQPSAAKSSFWQSFPGFSAV